MPATIPTGAGNFATAAVNAGTAITISKPANTADNDVLLAAIYERSSTAEFTTIPAGWTVVPPSGTRTTSTGWLSWYWHPVPTASSEPASYAWSGGTSGRITGAIVRVTGADLAAAIEAVGTDTLALGGTPQTLPIPSIAAVGANCLLVTNESSQVGTGLPAAIFNPPAGMTKVTDVSTTTAAQNNTLGVSFKQLTASGATGVQSFSASNTLQSGIGYGIVVKSAAPTNVAPTANAGSAQTVDSFATVTLSGAGSSDSDGTIASYAWTQTAGPAVTLSGTGASRTFTAPADPAGTSVTFGLVVTDNSGATSTQSTVTVTVRAHVEWLMTSGGLVAVRVQ